MSGARTEYANLAIFEQFRGAAGVNPTISPKSANREGNTTSSDNGVLQRQ